MGNETRVETFILLGFSKNQHVQSLLFILFLILYILTVIGNLLIVVTVNTDSSLHSPMYYFLGNLAFVDLCYPSVTTPKMLRDFITVEKTIPFNDCMSQIFFFHFFGGTECFVLTIMAVDRYAAICNPLRYTTIMSSKVRTLLGVGCWVAGAVHSTAQILLMLSMPFCGPNEIDHIFCDVPPLIKLACRDSFIYEALFISNSGLISLVCFLVLVGSYTNILLAVRRRSTEGKRKALSTCGSHLIVVTLFFGPCLFFYMRPASTLQLDKTVAVFLAFITPLLNPLIYTLRNAEVKRAMKKMISKRISILLTAAQ